MSEILGLMNTHQHYHAHIYFDQATRESARALCEEVGRRFALKVGRFHEKLVGPHLKWSCQIIFQRQDFAEFTTWLELNRAGLSILVHPLTQDELADHTEHAQWLGEPVPLKLALFSRG
ncbi:DOPA 4,5-dioxygenase [Sinobacterium caligoides]|uniref:DOPA 4,5-dioxygenase n=1 Tax=Sinobacterium caligoides TaxID=933926 RepID=A0A3N2E006_9GAMM|nr:DOPA 4,5-dioxygenase family protein [Sinobacterium caligoides]ROS05436.1 DOPA 4,5-dioxygenase [Sinobacterium caligoides]